MFPIFSIVSNNFEKDLEIVKRMFSGIEEMTHSEHGFKLSDRAELAAGWWFYDIFVTQDFAKKMFQKFNYIGFLSVSVILFHYL